MAVVGAVELVARLLNWEMRFTPFRLLGARKLTLRSSYRNLYNVKYQQAKSNGWSGWGSADREDLGYELFNRVVSNKYVPKSGECLELGCGEGQLSRKLAAYGYSVTGVDISDTAIEWAKQKNAASVVASDFLQFDLTESRKVPGGPYHMIVDGNCLHCISGEGRAVFLDNVFKSLAPKGVFYVSSRCSKYADEIIMDSGLKYRNFTTQSHLMADLTSSGFRVLDKNVYDRGRQVHVDIVAEKTSCV